MASINKQKLMLFRWLKRKKGPMQHQNKVGNANEKSFKVFTTNVDSGNSTNVSFTSAYGRWSKFSNSFSTQSKPNKLPYDKSYFCQPKSQPRFCGGQYSSYRQFSLNCGSSYFDKPEYISDHPRRRYSWQKDETPHKSNSNIWLHSDKKKKKEVHGSDYRHQNIMLPFSMGRSSLEGELGNTSKCLVANSNQSVPNSSEGICCQSKDAGKNGSADDAKEDIQHEQRNQIDEMKSKTEILDRVWIDKAKGQSYSSSVHKLATCSIMSYNILSQTLLEINKYLYKHCDEEVLPWNFRWNNMKKEMDNFKVDVLCLQEIENKHYFDDVKPWLDSRGYQHAYKKRTGHDPNKPDGVLTACLSSKYEIVETIPVEYFRPNDSRTKWHNVGLILILQVKSVSPDMPSRICVANTHLLYNPRRGDIKLIQLATLFAEINRVLKAQFARTGSEPPVIICGDFNSTPNSPLCRLITTGELQYEDIPAKSVSGQGNWGPPRPLLPRLLPPCLHMKMNYCVFSQDDDSSGFEDNNILRHNLGSLVSSCDEHRQLESTTIQNKGITVDYIFYSNSDRSRDNRVSQGCEGSLASGTNTLDRKGASASDSSLLKYSSKPKKLYLTLNQRLSLCTSDQLEYVNGLPNHCHSSDHLPVVAEFQLAVSA